MTIFKKRHIGKYSNSKHVFTLFTVMLTIYDSAQTTFFPKLTFALRKNHTMQKLGFFLFLLDDKKVVGTIPFRPRGHP